MNFRKSLFLLFTICLVASLASFRLNAQQTDDMIPHLSKTGDAYHLVVHGKPYLILGGELGNSTYTSIESMKPVWSNLKKLNVNTILAPVYWELIEPEKGKFDFQLFDDLLLKARRHDFKLVILWFGSWKNSMSSHAPSWIKLDQDQFPRVKDDKGRSHEILTPFSEQNLNTDKAAFVKLMEHIKEVDSKENTVIMIQPENEIGMLPTARDYHPLSNEKFSDPVPKLFIDYITINKDNLVPEFYQIWEKNGFKTSGNWEEIFGKGSHTDEIFMAWYFSRFTDEIVRAGKTVYDLPMFVNAALNRPGREPGKGYPSAGPLPHIMDVWRAGAPSIDFVSPDFYNPDIKEWCDLYTRKDDNPLFIPEHRFDKTVAAKALFTIGHYESLGFSPFSIESKSEPQEEDLGKAYELLSQLSHKISEYKGMNAIEGVLSENAKDTTLLTFGEYLFKVKHSHTLGWEASASNELWEPGGAIIIHTGSNEFYIAGSGIVVTFSDANDPSTNIGILKAESGRIQDDGAWEVIRHLNGDQTHQGRHIRIFEGDFQIQRVELYSYD